MKNIYQNPYRIIGILSNATAREIQARKTKIQAFTRVGKPIDSEYDFNFLEDITRDETSITKAFSDIEQNIGKVIHSLFWFINYSSFDQMALEHLKNGDTSKAKEIWHKLTNGQEISAKNFSAYSNIATLWLLSEEEMSKVTGIQYKIKLIESGYFTDFVHLVADETYNIDKNKQIEIFIDEVLKGKNISSQSLIQQLSGYAKTYLTQKATEEPVYSIETAVESCEEKRSKDKSNTYKYAKELYTNTQKPLAELKNILGIQDLKYQTMADSVAKELKQCAVDNWNNSNEKVTDLKKSIELATLANKIATGKTLKEDIQKDIKTLEGMKDRELKQAVELLRSIKNAYEENEKKIRKEVEEMQTTDIAILSGWRTINWTAVKKNIRSSISWEGVNDLLKEILIFSNLKKIKESDKIDLKSEFWDLLNWIKDISLEPCIVTNIIDSYKNIPPKLGFEILSVEVFDTDNKPFYIEDIRYIGVKLNIKSFGTGKYTIYKKYINPKGQYSHNSNISPEGYTTSEDIEITPTTTVIDLGGWGNKDKCTYEVGEHKVEIYIDHYKVYTQTFHIDWSPKKKKELQDNIKLLKQKLVDLKNELVEIEKFQWFRLPNVKEKQVKEAQDKIKETVEQIKKAENLLMNI